MLIVLKPKISAIFLAVYLPVFYSIFLNPSDDANEFYLSAPSFIPILHFIVFLSSFIITLPSVSSFIYSAISDNSYASSVIVGYYFGVPLS